MPQVGLEAFVSSVCAGGSDGKIACETTLSDDAETRPYNNNTTVSPTDSLPVSYYLSKNAQLEWLSDNAFFDRKDSQRGNSSNVSSNPNSNPSSQRFSLNSKASIIGLPKPQKTCFNQAKQRRNTDKIDNNRVFLKGVGSGTKTDLSLLEASSPMVSCIGRVRSKRERSRRMRSEKSGQPEKVNRVKKQGFLASFRAIFRIRGSCKDTSASGTSSRTHDIRNRLPPENVEPVVPLSLGAMIRLVSERRAGLLDG